MGFEFIFKTDENRALTAICAREYIRRIGVGSIALGMLNLATGAWALQHTGANMILIALGALLVATGGHALLRPSIRAVGLATAITFGLLLWQVLALALNIFLKDFFSPAPVILTAMALSVLLLCLLKLQPARREIEEMRPRDVEAGKRLCREVLRGNSKEESTIIRSMDGRCKTSLMADRALFVQRDMMRAFVQPKQAVREAIRRPESSKLVLRFAHPLGKVTYRFNRANSQKLKVWLAVNPPRLPARKKSRESTTVMALPSAAPLAQTLSGGIARLNALAMVGGGSSGPAHRG